MPNLRTSPNSTFLFPSVFVLLFSICDFDCNCLVTISLYVFVFFVFFSFFNLLSSFSVNLSQVKIVALTCWIWFSLCNSKFIQFFVQIDRWLKIKSECQRLMKAPRNSVISWLKKQTRSFSQQFPQINCKLWQFCALTEKRKETERQKEIRKTFKLQ